jgi:CubicO group peptidase (beta-lactamase class C family)
LLFCFFHTVYSLPNPAPLILACDQQHRQFGRAFALLEQATQQQAFPGAVLAVTYQGRLIAYRAVGQFTYDSASPKVQPGTVYDLASVTKVVATTAAAMVLFERGKLELEMPLVQVLPEFAGPDDRRRAVTLSMLLAHSTGLPSYARLFETAPDRESILRAACSLPLQTKPGTHTEYSDIGFVLLGEVLQRLTGEALDRFCAREVFIPLGMAHTRFCPPPEWRDGIPPTEDDRSFRKRVIQGEVQDENASAMGGVAGHAGLFAPAADVATFAECMLNHGTPLFASQTVEVFTLPRTGPAGAARTLGWDVPSRPSQSGQYFSARSFGHLGYAGTSLWIDPKRQLSVTLLTNRTWPDRLSQSIKRMRPMVHDAVIEALEVCK